MGRSGNPSEKSEQIQLCRRLERAGLDFFAVPNGGKRGWVEGALLVSEGVQSGVSDLIIVTPPPGLVMPTALEMKRVGGDEPTDAQRAWLKRFQGYDWTTGVGFGWRDALRVLRELGYRL